MSAPGGAGTPRERPVEEETSADDTDRGWGDEPAGDDDERFLRDRPPHWG